MYADSWLVGGADKDIAEASPIIDWGGAYRVGYRHLIDSSRRRAYSTHLSLSVLQEII